MEPEKKAHLLHFQRLIYICLNSDEKNVFKYFFIFVSDKPFSPFYKKNIFEILKPNLNIFYPFVGVLVNKKIIAKKKIVFVMGSQIIAWVTSCCPQNLDKYIFV